MLIIEGDDLQFLPKFTPFSTFEWLSRPASK